MLARPNPTDMLTLTIPGHLSMSHYLSAYHLEPANPMNRAGGSPISHLYHPATAGRGLNSVEDISRYVHKYLI